MGDVPTLIQYVERIGIIGILSAIILGGFKKWWVWGWALDDEKVAHQKTRDDRDQWMRMALGNMTLADRAVQHASNLQTMPTPPVSRGS